MPDPTASGSVLLAHEATIRLTAFVATLAALSLWEQRAPRRPLAHGRTRRWPANLGLAALSALLLQRLAPAAAVATALAGEARGGSGLLPVLALPPWLAAAAAVVLLDLAIYLQHVLFHRLPALWRLHRVHHSDLDLDVTTALRFHPLEILLSLGVKLAAIAVLGAPAAAVLLFEILLSCSAMFNHSNARLPTATDRLLRRFVVTPDMHRTHHSAVRAETDSCFGFALPWWDHLFGTYRPAPAAGLARATIGVEAFRDPRGLGLGHLLLQPLRPVREEENPVVEQTRAS